MFYSLEKKIADVDRVLNSISRLSNITSVADYGVPVWWKKDKQQHLLDKYQTLQNKVLEGVLQAFKSSPIKAIEIEDSLPLYRT